MYLSKISGRNLKGGDFDISLTQANVIVGDNFAGKTRIADAVRLVLIGYLPELGNTAKATFGLSSGSSMEVIGTFDDGSTIRRRWFLKGDSIKTEKEIPPAIEACGLLTVMLNAEEYFALSDRARVDYVFANCQIEHDLTLRGIEARLEKVAPGFKIPKREELLPLVINQAFLEKVIDDVAEEWKLCKTVAVRMEETVRGLTELRSSDDVRTRSVAIIKDDKQVAADRIAELGKEKDGIIGAYTAIRSARARRPQIDREISQSDKDRVRSVELGAKIKLINAEITALPAPVDTKEILEKIARVKIDIDTFARSESAYRKALEARELELQAVDGKDVCPYCGAAGEGWKAIKLAEIVTAIDAIKEGLAKDRTALELLEPRYTDLLAQLEQAREKHANRERLMNELRACDDAFGRLMPSLSRATALEEERGRLPAEDPKIEARIETIQTEINVLNDRIRGLDRELEQAIGRQRDLAHLAEAEKGRDKARADQEAAKLAGQELREIQSELVEAAFRPLLENANAIFGGVLKSPIAYKSGEIGSWRDGIWVGHRTFSGVEKALVYAAIQAALASKSPVRLMLIDELGRLNTYNAELVAAAVHDAVDRGLIDQFIGIDPERAEIYSSCKIGPGFNVIPVK